MKRRQFLTRAMLAAGGSAVPLVARGEGIAPCPPILLNDTGTGTPAVTDCSSAEADWSQRISGPSVVWFHDFRSKAEVDNFRWTGGYRGGNDPLAAGSSQAANTRRITSDGVTGGGCLELFRPAGTAEGSGWWRPFSALDGSGNGRGTNDPGASGTMPAQSYQPTDGGNEIYNWHFNSDRPGWYAHSSNHVGEKFDGDEFYLQMRVKMDPRRTQSGNTQVGKLLYLTHTRFSLSSQEVVTYSGAFTNPGGMNYHRMYAVNFTPLEQHDSLDRPGLQVGSDLANYGSGQYCDPGSQPGRCWGYSGGWDTILYHVKPGRANVQETRMEVLAAHEGQTSYTKIWDLVYSTPYDTELNLLPGWNALICSTYNNGQQNGAFWHRYDQIIFSKAFIPCPKV